MDLSAVELAEMLAGDLVVPVWIEGHRSRIAPPRPMSIVRAPRGVRTFVADEMTVTCGAGTPVEDLAAVLAEHGQYVNVPHKSIDSGTVGGALAVGEGDIFRLGRGSVRDVLLQATLVTSGGEVVKAGGPTVKNVSGFDLCRLLVGSCGRLGFMVDVILRTRPIPLATRWYRVEAEGWSSAVHVFGHLRRPSAVLWSGTEICFCLEGHPGDLDEEVESLSTNTSRRIQEVETPAIDSFPHRWNVSPQDVPTVVGSEPGQCLAELGTGIVHHRQPRPTRETIPAVGAIERRLLASFDPWDRLNGGSSVWGMSHSRTPLVNV